jgi:alpha-2-macroglobulin-like protein
VTLTQHDEVAFPVAVYSYLKAPQAVTLELQPEPWFTLLDQGGLTRKLDLQPGEVTSVKFRIRADRIGFQPLTVKARGSKLSDAVKRVVEVVPNGQKFEKVINDRLSGKVAQTIDIPPSAIPDASRLLVRVYPGVVAQVLEGTEGMLRLPGG